MNLLERVWFLLENLLIKVRSEKNMSQELLANKADISISQVSRIERGLLNSTLNTIFLLSYALDIESCNLLEFPNQNEIEKGINI